MSNVPPPMNPYEPTAATLPAAPTSGRPFPLFCSINFIASIVFCCLRAVMVLFGVIGVFVMAEQQPDLVMGGIIEVCSGTAMVVFGLLGNFLMLVPKKRIGLIMGWLLVVSVLANVGGALAFASMNFEANGIRGDALAAAWMGAIVVLGIRLVILGCYVAALFMFNHWLNSAEQRPA